MARQSAFSLQSLVRLLTSRVARGITAAAIAGLVALFSGVFGGKGGGSTDAGARPAAESPVASGEAGGDASPSGMSQSASRQDAAQSGIGFRSRRQYDEHFAKHGREFGNITQAEYLKQAQALRDRAAGGEVLEIKRKDGIVTRFDRESGAFLAFNPDRTIRTYFRPNDGESYFRRQATRERGDR